MGAVLPCSFARLHANEDRKAPAIAPSTQHTRRISGGILATSFTRLHITPFSEELQDRILAPSIKAQAENISFHTKQTFPERGFGFVDLPAMEAEKLKKKLNGATLKGAKVRIEDAKPEKKRKSDEEDAGEGKARKSARRDKKKREEGVLPGHELEEGRRVKRGWTEDDEEGKASKAKGKQGKTPVAQDEFGGKKLRFRTMPPPNTVPMKDEQAKGKKDKKDKKDKKVVVEEFSKSKKALVTSGEDDGTHGELSYEDDKGWVDQNGNVVEAERPSKRPSRQKAAKETTPNAGAIESTETNDFAHDDNMVVDHAETESSKPADKNTATGEEAPEKEVHPLEALFKRPTSSSSTSAKNRPQPINTSFSFFDAAIGEEDTEMSGAVPPKTPNTKRDLEWRSIRSAAPTPDTAAIGRKFSFPFASGDDEDEESDDEEDTAMEEGEQAEAGASPAAGEGQGEESAFRKWFYEHRGEFNRGWKKRRREEKKAKRQRENRRLSRRMA